VRSLTHGLQHGLTRFKSEIEILERLARENIAGLVADIKRLSAFAVFDPDVGPYVNGVRGSWSRDVRRKPRALARDRLQRHLHVA
jgi:hypothetical protein